jgi:antitoxin component of MazEF toxin-antitoxin module
MERIDLLLEKLDGRIPQSLAKKIDKLDDLDNKLEVAQQEFNSDPSDENKESIAEIEEFIEDFEQEIFEQLETLYEKRKEDVAKSKVIALQNPNQAKSFTPETPKEEKKESSGVLGLVIGAVLLVGSLGAINYFKNNR